MTVDELSLLIDDGPIYALSGDTVHKVRLFIVTEGLIEEITQRVGNVCKMRMTPDRKYLVIRGYQHNHKMHQYLNLPWGLKEKSLFGCLYLLMELLLNLVQRQLCVCQGSLGWKWHHLEEKWCIAICFQAKMSMTQVLISSQAMEQSICLRQLIVSRHESDQLLLL